MFKIPRLNSYVYILTYDYGTPYCITKDKVYMKNNEAFITEGVLNEIYIDEYRKEQYFKDYQKTWFTSLKEIRNYLRKNGEEKYKIIKANGGEWNIEEKE